MVRRSFMFNVLTLATLGAYSHRANACGAASLASFLPSFPQEPIFTEILTPQRVAGVFVVALGGAMMASPGLALGGAVVMAVGVGIMAYGINGPITNKVNELRALFDEFSK